MSQPSLIRVEISDSPDLINSVIDFFHLLASLMTWIISIHREIQVIKCLAPLYINKWKESLN